MTFTILKSNSREEWLEQRQNFLTATDIVKLYNGQPETWENIRQSKINPPEEFYSPYTEWGKEREPEIVRYSKVFIDSSLQPNDQLYVSTKYPRIAATPDMVSTDAVGDVFSGEIKTSKTDLSIIPLKYEIQMEVQMLVLGTTDCAFVWEQYEEVLVDGERKFIPKTPNHQMYKSDPVKRQRIIEIANRFYGEGEKSDSEDALEELLKRHAEIVHRENLLKAEKEQIRLEMLKITGDQDFQFSSPIGKITYFSTAPRTTFDAKKFAEDHPDLHSQYLKQGAPGARSLRITLPKEEK